MPAIGLSSVLSALSRSPSHRNLSTATTSTPLRSILYPALATGIFFLLANTSLISPTIIFGPTVPLVARYLIYWVSRLPPVAVFAISYGLFHLDTVLQDTLALLDFGGFVLYTLFRGLRWTRFALQHFLSCLRFCNYTYAALTWAAPRALRLARDASGALFPWARVVSFYGRKMCVDISDFAVQLYEEVKQLRNDGQVGGFGESTRGAMEGMRRRLALGTPRCFSTFKSQR